MADNQNDKYKIKNKLIDCLNVVRLYDWLLDSNVLDFFVDDQWKKLPSSWSNALERISPEDLTPFISRQPIGANQFVWPLSLLALKTVSQHISIDRAPVIWATDSIQNKNSTHQIDSNNNTHDKKTNCLLHPKIKTILTQKKVKAKKRHEIERMSQYTAKIAKDNSVDYIVDFGAGLGHLARSLAFGYGLNVCCLEKQPDLTEHAKVLDDHIENMIKKYCSNIDVPSKPVHLNMCLDSDTSFVDLVKKIRQHFKIDDNDTTFQFGIIGLHPCGDLASTLIKFFVKSMQAKFLNLVGCCHFKITVLEQKLYAHDSTNMIYQNVGFPVSVFLREKSDQYHLSFEAREISCHAIENYAKRLSNLDYDYLRIHSYRAAIEQIICKYWPTRKRSGLKSIKHLTTFREYCKQAITSFDDMEISEMIIDAPTTVDNLNKWKRVVIFYTLRLMLAPIVESAILYDRMLGLQENGHKTTVRAIFDPVISPRNHIITAVKL